MTLFLIALVNGLEMGCVYALIALGLCLIFGTMRIVNFAHGEFLMLGAFATYYFFGVIGINYLLSFILTMILLFAFGFVIEKAFLRPLRGNLIPGFIFTLGLSIFLMNLGFIVFGTTTKGIPSVFPGLIHFGNVHTSVEKVTVAVIALALMGGLLYMLARTKLGRAFRAVAQDSEAAQLQGVSTGHISSLSLAISAALAAASGSLLGCIFTVSPAMGVRPLGLAFIIVVIGGLGSIPGAILGGLLVGLVENFVAIYMSSAWAWGAIFLAAFLVLIFKPQGLMGRA
jgi:branched-chain amino acid transport system permease protein